VLAVQAPDESGQLPVFDVATLAGGALLVAHGNHGARILGLDGRTRAQWDIPTHQLVVADHGGSALLANSLGDNVWELHRLNLSTRQVRLWLTIRVAHLERSFDGITLTVVDDGTINFLDARAETPKLLWRELNDVGAAVAVRRSPGQLAAAVRTHPTPIDPSSRLELWQWQLPGITLRSRSPLTWPEGQAAITSSGVFLSLVPVSLGLIFTAHDHGKVLPQPHIDATSSEVVLTSNGLAHALTYTSDDAVRVDVTPQSPGPASISVTFPGQAQAEFTVQGDTIAVWDRSGRIVVVDSARHRVICSLRTRL
jgi:hypothetical protein